LLQQLQLGMNPTDAALNRYLQEIGSIPLLAPEEEIQIARKIQRGDAVARERLIQANLRLVVTVARDYINLGLPLLDLISEGNIGLMKAVDRFDPEKKREVKHVCQLVDQTGNQARTCQPEQDNPITRSSGR
jgi:DNA-directed RNA polymerase sigma subunit (sigma70/sigma32)